MPLKLNFTIPNKAVHAFIGLVVLLFLAGVIAYTVSPGTVPNPGHSLSTIQGFFQGDASLLDSLGKLQQRSSTMSCGVGEYVKKINADGTVTCELGATGAGDNLGNHIATEILNMSNFKIINLLTPTNNNDAANKAYVDAQVSAAVGPGSSSFTFEVYNPDITTWECVDKQLEDYCGDADGCTIRLLMQHETDGWDQVRIIDEHIYMEQPALSNNHGAGLYGWTRQGGGGDYGWITGMGNQYHMFSPWSWIYMSNYRHDWCPGQIGNSPAYADPYFFTFMSHPHIRTTVIVYDSTA